MSLTLDEEPQVTLVTDKYPPHRSYALKVLDKEHIKREKKTKYVLIERDTLKTLDGHPGIVRLYWTFQDQRSLCKSLRSVRLIYNLNDHCFQITSLSWRRTASYSNGSKRCATNRSATATTAC